MAEVQRGPFYGTHVPDLWEQLRKVFHTTVVYNFIGGGLLSALDVILTEGAEGESRSPGRFTHMTVWNSDLGVGVVPQAGDWIEVGTQAYDIVRTDVTLVGVTHCIVQRNEGVNHAHSSARVRALQGSRSR